MEIINILIEQKVPWAYSQGGIEGVTFKLGFKGGLCPYQVMWSADTFQSEVMASDTDTDVYSG